MANLRKILAIKPFRIIHQIHKGYASLFVKPFSSRLLQIFNMFNCRFQDYSPRFVLVELFKHKERIVAASNLQPEALLECLHEMLARVDLMDEAGIPIGTWLEARRLCLDVDPKDTLFVALTLHLDGRLRTGDESLKEGLLRKGFNRLFEG